MKKSMKNNIKEKGSVMQWVLVVILGAIAASLIFSIIKISIRYFQVRVQVSSLNKSIEDIVKEQKNIQDKLNSQKDPAFLELEARTKFNYQLPGEHVFVFLESTSSPKIESAGVVAKIISWSGKLGENPKSWTEYFLAPTPN